MTSLLVPEVALGATAMPNQAEGEFLELLSAERASHGVGTLEPLDSLVGGARRHAADMAAAGYIFHNTDLGSVLADGWNKLGENVGVGYSAATLHQAFMNSPGHRANALDASYDAVGIGTAETDGAIYVVFVFADMIESGPVAAGAANSFSDDDGSVFESSIEALAAAGITTGCGPGLFCPDQPVTRGQMAAFLVRALRLPAVSAGDRFSDDDDSVFESSIEALAAAGITTGCGPGLFCPDQPVTRGQMAAFLVRALGR